MGLTLLLNVTNASTAADIFAEPFKAENVEFEAKNNFPLFWRLMFRDEERRVDTDGNIWLLADRAETIVRLDRARPVSDDDFANNLLDAFVELLTESPGANVIARGDILHEPASGEHLDPSPEDIAHTIDDVSRTSAMANASTTEVNALLLTGQMSGKSGERFGLTWPPPTLVRPTPRPPQRPKRPQRPGERRPLADWRSPASSATPSFPVGVVFGLEPGDRVEHRDFGVGVVVAAEGSGDDEKVQIVFGSAEPTELLLSWAPLRRA